MVYASLTLTANFRDRLGPLQPNSGFSRSIPYISKVARSYFIHCDFLNRLEG